jgi:hypothetical protein
VLALRYDDDEPGSPWDFFLYLDQRATPPQREALEGTGPARAKRSSSPAVFE